MKKMIRRSEEASRNNNNNNNAPSSIPARGAGVCYKECQKNHAAAMGGYAVDGCMEFLASAGEVGSEEAFACAACGCHRNFHRRQVGADAVVVECNSPPNSSSTTTT